MSLIRNREIRGILAILFVIFVLGVIMAGMSGMLDRFGLWFTGPKAFNKIVFVSDRGGSADIFLMNTDGSEQKQLTSGARVGSAPVISPLANKIVFFGSINKSGEILKVGAGGGTAEPIVRGDGHPSFSPDGNKLAYIANGKIEVAGANGDNPDPVLPTHSEIHEAMANALDRSKVPAYIAYAWGPDSNSMTGVSRDKEDNDTLVYLPKLEGKSDVIAAVAKDANGKSFLALSVQLGKAQTPLLPLPVGQTAQVTNLEWAAKAPVMVASLTAGPNNIMIVLNAEKGTCQPIANVKGQELTGIGISPDGNTIVFAVKSSNAKMPSGIMKLDLSAGNGAMIAQGIFKNPAFSPKGDKILAVKVGEDSETGDVVSIDPSNGEVKQLTTDGHSIAAIWSPVSEQ